MKSILRDDLKRYSFPSGVHVVEVIGSRELCRFHEHFAGMDCLQFDNLRDYAHTHDKEEPVLVHCTGEVDCHLAVGMLEYAGFEKVYRYEGEVGDLRPYGWHAAAGLGPEEARRPDPLRAGEHGEWHGFKHLPPWVEAVEPEAPEERVRPLGARPTVPPGEELARERPYLGPLREEERGFKHLPPWVEYAAPAPPPYERPWLEYEYSEARTEAPGYGAPYGGLEEDRLGDERQLEWAAIEDELNIYVELAEPEPEERIELAPPPAARPWLDYDYSEARTEMPGYAAPFGGVEEDRVRDERKLSWQPVEEAGRVEAARETLRAALGPVVIGRDRLLELMASTPRGHLTLIEVTPTGECAPKRQVVCLAAEETERLGEVLDPEDVAVFRADDEREAEIAYRRLQRTPVGTIYRYKGSFEECLPG